MTGYQSLYLATDENRCPHTEDHGGTKFVCLKPLHNNMAGHVMAAEERR